MATSGFVYVIESPSDMDLLDGRTEGRALSEALRLSKILHWYSLATTKRAFLEAVTTRLGEAWKNFSVLPILHLSMHGNDQGIALTNGDFITWEELRTILRPLNDAMSGSLLICLSACNGTAACRMAMHEDAEKTFWAVVSNQKSPTWSDSAVAYITFYSNFFKDVAIDECVNRMCTASGDDNFMHLLGEQAQQHWIAYINDNRPRADAKIPQATASLTTTRKPTPTIAAPSPAMPAVTHPNVG